MLQQMWAKVTQREKFIVIGAAVAVVAWLIGLLITDGWYSAAGAQTLGLLAVIAAVIAIGAVYVKYAPNMTFTWPAPYPMILLVLAAIVLILGIIGLFQAFTYDPFQGFGSLIGGKASKPVTLYIVTIGVVVGGAIMAWGAYQEYLLNKGTTPPSA